MREMADARPARPLRPRSPRYKGSNGSLSSGVPEPVPEDHVVTFGESNRVAVSRSRDDDDVACFAFTLPDAGDDRRFDLLLRRRVVAFWWLLCVVARLAESTNIVNSGLGNSAASQIWTAALVVSASVTATAPPPFQAACLERAHHISLAYTLVTHFVRLLRVYELSDAAREVEIRVVYASIRRSPIYYVLIVLQGFCVAFVCNGRLAFQALYVMLHLSISFAVTRAAGADFDEVAPSAFAWVVAVVAANGVVYGVLKPLWLRAQRGANEALKKRVEQLGREKERIVWEWQLDVSRLAPRLPDDDEDISSPPDDGDRSKRPGDVVLAGSPNASLGDLDLDFSP